MHCAVVWLEGVIVPSRFRRAFDTRPQARESVGGSKRLLSNPGWISWLPQALVRLQLDSSGGRLIVNACQQFAGVFVGLKTEGMSQVWLTVAICR